jgi:radical SAM protein with 4Fe4S-binding SPASM domain
MTDYIKFKNKLSQYLQENRSYPRSIFIEVTPLCNLRCVFCACYIKGEEVTRYRQNNYMSFDNFKKIIDRIAGKFNFQMNFTYSGEPLLNKDIFKMVSYLTDHGIPSKIYSNAMLLNPERAQEMLDSGLDRFIISFDSAVKETYEAIRIGGRFEQVVKNLRFLVTLRNQQSRSKPFIETQIIITNKNAHELETFKTLSKEIGVDNAYSKSLYIYRNTKDKDYVKKVESYFLKGDISRYEHTDNGFILKDEGECPEQQSCVITVDGEVVMCCFDLQAKNSFGNATETPLTDIWDSHKYRKFRQEVMAPRGLSLCHQCITSNPLKEDLQ